MVFHCEARVSFSAEQTLTLSAANARSEPNHVIQAMSQFGQTNLCPTAMSEPFRTLRIGLETDALPIQAQEHAWFSWLDRVREVVIGPR